MKAVILAGGAGTRISEETHLKPKPMITIGGMPILWHIMKHYSTHGVNDFVICCGYMGYMIKEYFANYCLHMSDVTFDMTSDEGHMHVHNRNAEPWRVTLVDTGTDTLTGGRLKRVEPYLRDEESFCFTYGDGVADIDITSTIEFHQSHSRHVTVTAVQPPGRFGALKIDADRVTSFDEKPQGDNAWINGGFFVLSSKIFDYLEGDMTTWEGAPLANLSKEDQVRAFRHKGFWHPMDTLRDRVMLEKLWAEHAAPWKSWS